MMASPRLLVMTASLRVPFLLFAIVNITVLRANANELSNLEPYSFQMRGQLLAGGGESSGVFPDPSSVVDWANINWPENKIKSPKDNNNEQLNVKEEIEKLENNYVNIPVWHQIRDDVPVGYPRLGGISAVSFDVDGNVVIFHRGDRVWDEHTFNSSNVFMGQDQGPIGLSTVLALEPDSGAIAYECGKNMFYMPHGLTVDHENNIWMTDVAMHQVIKYGPCDHDSFRGRRRLIKRPMMVLGKAFQPGAGDSMFCKPTSVVILPENGDFFVADGYCNARIIKFSANGQRILTWGRNSFSGGATFDVSPPNYFAIPHDLTFIPNAKLLCVADRENGRIQCFHSGNGTFHSQYHSPLIGDRLFSVDYTPAEGGQFVVVNGPTGELGVQSTIYHQPVNGYIVDISQETAKVASKFNSKLQNGGGGFSSPHDVAVTPDGKMIFVAEIHPPIIHKFVRKEKDSHSSLSVSESDMKTLDLTTTPTITTNSSAKHQEKVVNEVEKEEVEVGGGGSIIGDKKKTATSVSAKRRLILNNSVERNHHPNSSAIMVALLMSLFILFTFCLALVVAHRRRRRGNTINIGSLSIGQLNDLVYRKLVDRQQSS